LGGGKEAKLAVEAGNLMEPTRTYLMRLTLGRKRRRSRGGETATSKMWQGGDSGRGKLNFVRTAPRKHEARGRRGKAEAGARKKNKVVEKA